MRLVAAALAVVLASHHVVAQATVFDIGNIRPEGIHVVDGADVGLDEGVAHALVSEFYYGGIKAVNLESGEVMQIVDSQSFGQASTVGLWCDSGVILAAGGGAFVGESVDAVLHVFDAMTGEEIITCLPQGGGIFMNDVTVLDGTAHVTDSFSNRIMTVDMELVKNGVCDVSSVEINASTFTIPEVWAANGIIPYGNGLLIAHETFGAVYYLDLSAGTTSEIIPAGAVEFADGLCIDNDAGILYVAQNQEPGPLTAWRLSLMEDGAVSAQLIGTIESSDFDSPATCDISGGNIYVPNARFGSLGLPVEGEEDLSTFTETFQVVGVNRFGFSTGPTDEPSPCQSLTTQEGFDLAQYIQARWYSQQQRPSPFQPAELNFCTTADYFDIDPAEFGYMNDYSIKVFNTAQDAEGNVFTSDDEAQVGPDPSPLCGLQDMPDTDPAMLQVGNCFAGPQGPYWVLEYDEAAGYAIISGGQPTIPTTDGLCTYPSPFNGLWIFTRDPARDEALIAEANAKIIAQGIDPSTMLPVNQQDCEYPDVPTPSPPPEPTSPPSSSVTLTPANFQGCMAVNGAGAQDDSLLLANCDPSDARQQFVFDGSLIRLALDDTMCIQAGRSNPDLSPGHWLRVFPCDASNSQQLFSWVPPDGALTLVEFSGLTVVFQGTTANVGTDRIIVGDLSTVGDRKNWEVFS